MSRGPSGGRLPSVLALAALLVASVCGAQERAPREATEYRLKAAFVYNFLQFTEWPRPPGATLTLCVAGTDPFGAEIDALQGKSVGSATLEVQRRPASDGLLGCEAVFASAAAIESMLRQLDGARGGGVLTIADAPGAMQRGVMLNLRMADSRVGFEANLAAARNAGLKLSSKLMRLALEVLQ